ncbi:MAG: hypothetical protein Kow00124_21030 [Anaerolineae bacterium]
MRQGFHVLLATLGSEAQVITITLDLLARSYTINHAVILHTGGADSPANESLARLQTELESDPRYRSLTYRTVCFVDDSGLPLADITTPAQNRTVFRTTFEALKVLKREGATVHFSAAGGRKAMASYALLSAQFLFDEDDRFWNLWSAPALLQEKRMHANPGEAELIRLPIPPWHIGLLEKEAFIESLTQAEREVLELLARGYKDDEIADCRVTTIKTAQDQVRKVRKRVIDRYGFDKRNVRYSLIREFSPYYDLMDALGYPTTYGTAVGG